MTRLFLQRSNDRRLPETYRGDVLIWDIDKTYLDTRFSSWRGLAAIPFELAIDKEAIPGSVPLLRALRRGAGEKSALVPLYFVSGSPPQLRSTIERKMTLDGVDFDGITFKDQVRLFRSGRFRAIKAQVGYKLLALLLYRQELPQDTRWSLFGDDVESDAETFLLFGEVCAGIRGAELEARLLGHHVEAPERRAILELTATLPIGPDPVEHAYIHLTEKSDPRRFDAPRLVAARSFLQLALLLHHRGKIRANAVMTVASDLRMRHVPEAEIEADLADARTRLSVPDSTLALARPASL